MNTMIKNLLGLMIAVGIPFYVGATLYSSYYDRAADPGSFRDFYVTGDGQADVKPDIATLQLSVLTEGGNNVTELQKNNTDKMNKVSAFIKSKNVKDEDVTTSNYSITPRYQYFDCSAASLSVETPSANLPSVAPAIAPETMKNTTKVCPPPAIVGYSISQTVNVKVRDFSVIGDILSGATAQGVNSVSGPNFDIDDPSPFQKSARDQAIARAKEKAEQVAKAAGFKLGRLISVNENVTSGNNYYAEGKGGGGDISAAMAPAPQINPGTQRLTVEATLRYEMK